MGQNNVLKVALVLYTSGLDYDDRIRKEILSIQRLYPNISFKIFAVDPKNREESGVTSYGVPYRIPFLKTREKYTSASHTLAKAWDFYNTVKKEIKEYDVLWCADEQVFLFILLSLWKPVIWDLHELPLLFLRKPYLRWLYKQLERKCSAIIHANQQRLNYLNEQGMVSKISKHFVLRNYPEFNEIDSEIDDTYRQFEQWKGDDKCVYLQGLDGVGRADIETISAVLSVPSLKAVVVGSINDKRMKVIEKRYGKEMMVDRLFFTGRIKQLKTPQYIRKCIMSLVFYTNGNMNNWYCEPNRLFQNICNGNPVVVGNNPPMKELIDNYHIGVCADTDGISNSSVIGEL